MQNINDEQLFDLIRKSNLEAFKTIYDRYFDQLYLFLSVQCHDADEVKDVIQEVFYQLWKKRKSIFIRKSLKAYLYRMVYNCMINIRKKNSRNISLQQDRDFKPNSIDIRDKLDNSIDLNMAIRILPIKIRPVYTLKVFNDLSNKEIARILSISIKTVESHITQAYNILKNLFFA